MKKIGAVFLMLLVLILSASLIAGAEEDSADKISKAYSCLKEKVNKNCNSLSAEEQAFSLLALAYDSGIQSECKSALLGKSHNDGECWPSGGCRLRDTSLALLALDNIGASTDDAESWLLSQKKSADALIWYLEIDTQEESSCKITYGSTEKTITIREDKTLSGSAGSCLSLSQNNYWLKVKDTCYNENFTISCNKDFVSALLYKKSTSASATLYVSSNTESAPAEGKTEHAVNSFCFKQGSSCDYEGSLWATMALAKAGKDVSEFLPFLIAMSDETENRKYFPSAFLYMIADYDEYFSTIVDEFKSSGYWEIPSSPYHKFYDTSLALLSLYGVNAEQADSAKEYLLEVQESNGCWRENIRDTAFILYAGWPKTPSRTSTGGGSDSCESRDYFCVSPLKCNSADLLDYSCFSGDVCCKTSSPESTCSEKGGIFCSDNQQCSGASVSASDATSSKSCCLGSCITQEQTECELEEFSCRFSCFDDEEQKPYDCMSGKLCCGDKSKQGTSWWWIIILLIILIILTVLAIIFRNQIKIWIFRIKNKFKKGPAPSRTYPGQGFPPRAPPASGGIQRMILPFQRKPIMRGAPPKQGTSKTDKELEETLRKLREMSK